jgi:ATP-binding cassette, subfamily B (MDR/TAP), member 1
MKMARLLQFAAQFIAGFAIGFLRGWRLTLVMLTILPALALAASLLIRGLVAAAARTQKHAAEAGESVDGMRMGEAQTCTASAML